jgi:group I intron endonuclease
MEKISAIYCFENIWNGKKYIGQAQNIDYRTKRHLRELRKGCDDTVALQNAWNKYGEKNFKFYIIEECPINLLNEREIFWIKELHSHVSEWGYNISWGGDSVMRGRHHTKETKEKISKNSPDKHGENGSFYGRKHTEESLRKISENHVDVSGEKNPMFGKKHTEETRKLMSDNRPDYSGENHPNFGGHMSEDAKRKSSETQTGKKKHSEEVKAKMSKDRIGKKRGKNTTSQYVGVCFDKNQNNWMAYVRHKGKTIFLKRYATEKEAALAYNSKCIEIYGKDAQLNVIVENEEV